MPETTRTFTSPHPGPITLEVATAATDIRVTVADTSHATITLATDATTGPLYDLITDAPVRHGAGTMSLDITDQDTAGNGVTVIGGGANIVSVGSGSRSVVVSGRGRGVTVVGNRVWIDGREVTPGANEGHGGTLTLTATLPHGSSLTARTQGGDIRADGSYRTARAATSSGTIRIERAETAVLTASSGSLRIKHGGRVQANASSGSVRVDYCEEITAVASSGSIKVEHVRGQAMLSASSGSIDVAYSGPEPVVTVSSGSKRVRNIHPFASSEGAAKRRWFR